MKRLLLLATLFVSLAAVAATARDAKRTVQAALGADGVQRVELVGGGYFFDPQRIIFAGPMADLGDVFLSPVRETARRLGDAGREPAIVNSAIGLYNGAVGAASLALHHWKPR